LVLQKPLAAVPHGGGQQLTADSAAAQSLRQWVDLVAQSGCSAVASAPQTAYAANCAGCHGVDGSGLSGRQDIRCAVRSLVIDAVRRGRGSGAMPPFDASGMPAATLDEIVGELRTLCSGRAKDLYASNCASCHGSTAGGGRNVDGVFGPNIRCGGEDLGSALADGADRMPPFPELVGRAGALGAYLGGLCSLGGGGD
jgi:mono/diheme cytochrome c family protein